MGDKRCWANINMTVFCTVKKLCVYRFDMIVLFSSCWVYCCSAWGTSSELSHIPAASLPRDLGGILWCSVDAVSDTFRFLPFIPPPTHTVTLHSCWQMQLKTCDLPKYRGGGWSSSDVRSTAAGFVANDKRHKWRNPQVLWILQVSQHRIRKRSVLL